MQFPLHSAFLALPLEGEAKDQFRELQHALEPWSEILRFQNPATPHCTLYFWRELMQIEYGPVREAAAAIAAKAKPLTIETTGVETFGDRRGDRVVYVGVQFAPELADIKKRCPWPNPPDHPFRPHITIARIAHPERFTVVKKKVLRACGNAIFPITFDRLRLYAEIEGKKQTPIEEFSFQKE